MFAIGFLLVAPAATASLRRHGADSGRNLDRSDHLHRPALLWISALVTLYTGYDIPCGLPPPHGGRVKFKYFAWVRERIGRAEEEIEVPPA